MDDFRTSGELNPELHDSGAEMPWGQRIFDRPFLLLVIGLLIMLVFYTGWGLFEISSLEPAPLP